MNFAGVARIARNGGDSELRRRRKAATNKGNTSSPFAHRDGSINNSVPGLMKEESLASDLSDANTTVKSITTISDSAFPAGQHHSHDTNDVSVQSLLSAVSISDEEETLQAKQNEDNDELENLEKELEFRARKLDRICDGRSGSFTEVLRVHEEAARSLKNQRCRSSPNKGIDDRDNDGKMLYPRSIQCEVSKESKPPHPFLYAWWLLLFDFQNVMPAAFKVIVICCCHLFFHGALDTVTRMFYHNFLVNSMNKEGFSICEIIAGLCLLRANGYLWEFLDGTAYSAVKFDMHNRLHLGFRDAKLLAFFKSTVYGSVANLFGFYLVYVGLSQIFMHEFTQIYRFLEQWYTSEKNSIIERQAYNESNLHFYSWDGNSPGYSDDVAKTCHLLKQHVGPRLQWWFSYCCNDVFQEWKLTELIYYGLGLFAATVAATTVGVNVLRICDEE